MKIIIVDDDCLVAGALKTILEVNEDVQVLKIGYDGREACELYDKYQPDVLLMDIRMKEMDGLEASRQILKKYPTANILLLTTFSDAGLWQHFACASGSLFRTDGIWNKDHIQDPGSAPGETGI